MEKYIQQSSTIFGSIKNAVLGNPVMREFNIGQQVASFGPDLLWKVFEGKKKTTGQDVSIFIFEKSLIDRYGRKERELILENMRNGPLKLTKLRHPRILTVQHPLEESRDSLAFATEPVFGSLSNILGKYENFPNGLPPGLKDFELYAVEKVYGLLQIDEGLSFLHDDANLNEGNLTTDNIIITKGGQWKLAGFHFSKSKLENVSINAYSTNMPPVARQDLNYLAPEWILSQPGEFTYDLSKSDMFSFGCLISAVYNHLKTPFDAGDSIASYKKCTEQMSRLGSDYLKNVPIQVRDHVSLLLSVSAEIRPDSSTTLTHPFFDDVAAMTLKYLDSLVQRDEVTKSQFFKNLPHVLNKLPLRVLHQRILPPLFSEFPNHMMIPFVLPNVFLIAHQSTKDQYMELIFPELKKIFHINKPIQVLLIFMQQMEVMLKMTTQVDIKNYVLPLIFRALEAPSEQIQELVLTIIPNFVHMIDYSSLKNSIIPRLKTLVTKSQSTKVRVNALVCFGKIIDHIDKFVLIDEVFPALTQITSREPAILMAILGIYKQTITHKKVHLEKDYLAAQAIPFLLPLAVDPKLNVQQFNNFMSVIREMFDRVEQEHRTKLEQLQKMHDEQRSSIDFVKAANQNVDSDDMDTMMSKVNSLVVGDHDPTSNTKKMGADSEFSKMFGLSNDHSNTKPPSLMHTIDSPSTTSKTINTSSFDLVSSASSNFPNSSGPNAVTQYNTNRFSAAGTTFTGNPSSTANSIAANKFIATNLNQMNTEFSPRIDMYKNQQQPIPNMTALDSVFAPEMSQFQSRQQAPPLRTIQQSQYNYSDPFSQQSLGFNTSPAVNCHANKNQLNLQTNMNTNIFGAHGQGMSQVAGSSGQSSFIRPSVNTGLLQPMHTRNTLPAYSAKQSPNLSSKDIDDLLL